MTNISAASAGSAWFLQQANSERATARQAFQQLSSALQSGDLAGAQTAYSTLSQSIGTNANSPLASALQQIGSDLQSGDLTGAQATLSALQQQTQAQRAHHHHHHGKPNNDAQSAQQAQSASGVAEPNPAPDDGTGQLVNVIA
jgi:hypothetical protein